MATVPVLRLVGHAYLDLLGGWRSLVQIGAPWLIVAWVLQSMGGIMPRLLADLALSAGLAAIAVAWHRRLLLGEAPAGRLAPLTALVARYLVYSFIILILIAIPGMVLALPLAGVVALSGGAQPSIVLALVAVPVAILSMVLAVRLQLVFPAIAIDDRRMTLALSLQATRGHGLKLLGGLLLVLLPASLCGALAASLLARLAEMANSRVLDWLTELAPIFGAWIQAPLLASFLSFVYLALREPPPATGSMPV